MQELEDWHVKPGRLAGMRQDEWLTSMRFDRRGWAKESRREAEERKVNTLLVLELVPIRTLAPHYLWSRDPCSWSTAPDPNPVRPGCCHHIFMILFKLNKQKSFPLICLTWITCSIQVGRLFERPLANFWEEQSNFFRAAEKQNFIKL
jgi:hypothetical protein